MAEDPAFTGAVHDRLTWPLAAGPATSPDGGSGAFASATSEAAVAASRIPAPHSVGSHVLPTGNGVALAWRKACTCAGESVGSTDSMSDTTPTTCGVAMLVPL